MLSLPEESLNLPPSCFAEWLETSQFGLTRLSDVMEPLDILQNRDAVLCLSPGNKIPVFVLCVVLAAL